MCKDSDFFEIFYYLCIVYVLWRTIFFFMRQKRFFFYIFLFVILSTLGSCNTVKYVPEDQYLLKKVKIKASIPEVNNEELKSYLRQTPNNTILGFWPLKLGLYSASSNDSTKWVNRWLRKIGEPPVIYDSIKKSYGFK